MIIRSLKESRTKRAMYGKLVTIYFISLMEVIVAS